MIKHTDEAHFISRSGCGTKSMNLTWHREGVCEFSNSVFINLQPNPTKSLHSDIASSVINHHVPQCIAQNVM